MNINNRVALWVSLPYPTLGKYVRILDICVYTL